MNNMFQNNFLNENDLDFEEFEDYCFNAEEENIVDSLEDQQMEESIAMAVALTAALTQVRQQHGGSVMGHKVKDRGREAGAKQLDRDYFDENSVYDERDFRRRFRMRKNLFVRIEKAIEVKDNYFVQKRDAKQQFGFTARQKMASAIFQLGYGAPADSLDSYLRMAESTSIESLKCFCKTVIACFAEEYLRRPTQSDVDRLLEVNKARGFPGMLGSLDCMQWVWKNCPTSWHGVYAGKEKAPTIVLEAVASQDLWIWHCFFGVPGSNNDLTVLSSSTLFKQLRDGESPRVEYTINGNSYNMGYYLTDGIYPQYAAFVKSITNGDTEAKRVIHKKKM